MKKHNLALLTLILVGLFSLNLFAQKAENEQISNLSELDVLQKYIEVSSLPNGKRQKVFSDSSKEMMSNLFRFHLAFQFVKRPNLTKEQKDLILESIGNISSEDYDNSKDKTNVRAKTQLLELKVKNLFSKQEGFEIFANLGSNENDISILKSYKEIFLIPNLAERKDSFRKSPSSIKSLLWKTQLTLKLSGLSSNQQEKSNVIVELITLIDDDFYDVSPKSEKWSVINNQLSLINEKIRSNFSKQEAYEIFGRLGGKETSKEPPNTKFQKPNCSCSTVSDYCWGDSCIGGNCSGSPRGCGTVYWYSCNGMCYDV